MSTQILIVNERLNKPEIKTKLKTKQKLKIKNQIVAMCFGGQQNTELLHKMGLRMQRKWGVFWLITGSKNTHHKACELYDEATTLQSSSKDTAEIFFGNFKSTISSSKGSTAFQRFKESKFVDLAKKGYDIVKDELHGSPKKRKHLQHEPSKSPLAERSTRTKVQGHLVFKRHGVVTDPVVTKNQEIADDVRERWETSNNHIVHKIQDFNETIFQETDTTATIKEIQSGDITFSLPEFVTEVQEALKHVLKAYIKGDVETLKMFSTNEVIEWCKAEHSVYQNLGIFFDNKSVDDVWIRSKVTSMEIDVTVTVSRWRNEGVVGKVRLGTTVRGTDPETNGPLGDCRKEPHGG
ncbi:hypothetical protein UlMin_041652 [Ulmus minor]